MPTVRRILALDPSLRRTGWAVLDHDKRQTTIVARGLIVCAGDAAAALAALARELAAVIDRYQPALVAAESCRSLDGIAARSGRMGRVLAAVRIAVIATVAVSGVPGLALDQAVIKQLVTGDRYAAKQQVHRALERLAATGGLAGYSTPRRPHGAVDTDQDDAVAVGLAVLDGWEPF